MQVGEIGFAIKKPDGEYVFEGFSTRESRPFLSHKRALRRLKGVKGYGSTAAAPHWQLAPIPDGKVVLVKLVEVESL